jgi:hypothetical protein
MQSAIYPDLYKIVWLPEFISSYPVSLISTIYFKMNK